MDDSKTHLSQPAGALPRVAGSPEDGTTPERATSARERFRELHARLAAFQPSEPALLLWRRQLPEAKALEMGQRVITVRVLDDALTVLPALIPVLLEGPLPGYGPRRAHYAVSLALELDARYRGLRIIETGKAGASRTKYDILAVAQEKRQSFQRLLAKLTLGQRARQAELDKAEAYDHDKSGELVASLELLGGMGRSLLAEAATRPELAEIYADTGLTMAEVDSVEDMARLLAEAVSEHGEHMTARQTESDLLNILEGRLWFELAALTEAAADGRRRGRLVPTVRLTQLRRQTRRRRPPASEEESPTEPEQAPPRP